MVKFRLKVLRAELGNVTQIEVCEKTGIRRPTLSALENNTAKTISLEHINKLCEFFNCTPADLFIYKKS